MRKAPFVLLAALLATMALWAPSAGASIGLQHFDVTFENEDGSIATQAGSHPYSLVTSLEANTAERPGGGVIPDEPVKDLELSQMRGLIGNQTAVPRCATVDFLVQVPGSNASGCADGSVVGMVNVEVSDGGIRVGIEAPLYNLEPPPGKAAKLGFWAETLPVTTLVGVGESPPYNLQISTHNVSQALEFLAVQATVWGNPSSPVHDPERGLCYNTPASCPAGVPDRAFLTLPRACEGPLATDWAVDSWPNPGARLRNGAPDLTDPAWAAGSSISHDAEGNLEGMSGCGSLDYLPRTSSEPSTESAETGSGLDFSVDFEDEGLANPTGLADSDTKKTEVTLPEGMTINPSVGEGLAVCTPADLARETLHPLPGEGCPDASKLGTLQVETPLVDEALGGQIFLAPQDDPSTTKPGAENPFDSLIALYFVIRNANLGVNVKVPLKVEPDPETGQLVATLDDIPRFPLSHFEAHLRAGARAALVTPSRCGTYETKAKFTPWANPSQPLTTTSSFEITSGVRGGPCPKGGVPPFHPDFQAGSVNNNAGSFSPFNMRLIRKDGEQDMTKFSSVLPPGELGSLKGVGKCSDAAVALAKSKTGREELASPSCPANSLIGHTLAGAGVGEALTYVGGQVYLAGPYKGDPLSVISITPAVAGPFDAGTVVVRLALTLNPKTAEVEVDGANSDPIPHILKGIVLKVRDLRVYVDRPNFTLNPTSCDESAVKATLFGSYLDVFSPADDVPASLSTRFQAASCQSLGFKPKLKLQLKGGTKRGGHPGLTATYRPRAGDANVEGLVVRLPRSAFLDQAHIRTICTRVQFAADACPKGAQYGFIKAWTPLLDDPLQGPVWLRSSNHKLPDLVFDLQGLVDIEVATRIDSAKGGIRASLEDLPDAPLSKVVLTMQGAKKGLIINSRNLCGAKSRAGVQLSGQNGKRASLRPVMQADCGKPKAKKRR